MNDSSSDDSADEDEVLRNFDEEARQIVQCETLPKKSAERYLLVYKTYKQWQEENKHSLSNSDENNLIVYFNTLKGKLKPPTLWSIWSMLRKTLNSNENVNISNFFNLKTLLKNNAKGYKPKKAFTLRWDQIIKFMTEAVDHTYLAMKVILIFGICGALRCNEVCNMKFKDVENLGDKFLVSIHYNKNDYPGQFIIGNLFYNKVQQYISLRPRDEFSDRFFIQYHDGKCTRQAIGRHKIGEVPERIASYLNLENPKRYTGHCFRRSAATLLSDSGANMQMIKQLGRWRSDMIAQGYIENSMHNRQMIYEGITHQAPTNTSTSVDIKPRKEAKSNSTTIEIPSTSTEVKHDENIDIVNWSDFSDDLTADDFTDEVVENGFTTAGKRKIVTPPPPSAPSSSKLFLSRPPVKVYFNNQVTAQPPSVPSTSKEVLPMSKPLLKDLNNQARVDPPYKKHKDAINSDLQDQNDYDINSSFYNRDVKFDNCTFNSCVFNITLCKCDKENTRKCDR